MTRRSKIWLVVAVLFSFVNLAGAIFAAAQGEMLHAGVHAALVLPGAYLAWRLVPRRDARRGEHHSEESVIPAAPRELTDRLTHLEQAIDAIAIEIERIGEGQRFITRRFIENRTPRAAGEVAAEPIEVDAQETAPRDHHY
ncbi:MAG TPA: hypothetical protein VIQ74_04470 [Gemmatimonadaceae bacterium]